MGPVAVLPENVHGEVRPHDDVLKWTIPVSRTSVTTLLEGREDDKRVSLVLEGVDSLYLSFEHIFKVFFNHIVVVRETEGLILIELTRFRGGCLLRLLRTRCAYLLPVVISSDDLPLAISRLTIILPHHPNKRWLAERVPVVIVYLLGGFYYERCAIIVLLLAYLVEIALVDLDKETVAGCILDAAITCFLYEAPRIGNPNTPRNFDEIVLGHF